MPYWQRFRTSWRLVHGAAAFAGVALHTLRSHPIVPSLLGDSCMVGRPNWNICEAIGFIVCYLRLSQHHYPPFFFSWLVRRSPGCAKRITLYS